MQKLVSHINWIQKFQQISLLVLLFIYLIVPFKKHFLETVHFVSHLVSFENPNHSHDHSIQGYSHFHETGYGVEHEHEHNHNHLEVLNRILHEFGAEEQALPIELVNYRFQVELPSEILNVSDQLPAQFKNTFQPFLVLVLPGPSFEVPLPPP
jgi:hypothetical protein